MAFSLQQLDKLKQSSKELHNTVSGYLRKIGSNDEIVIPPLVHYTCLAFYKNKMIYQYDVNAVSVNKEHKLITGRKSSYHMCLFSDEIDGRDTNDKTNYTIRYELHSYSPYLMIGIVPYNSIKISKDTRDYISNNDGSTGDISAIAGSYSFQPVEGIIFSGGNGLLVSRLKDSNILELVYNPLKRQLKISKLGQFPYSYMMSIEPAVYKWVVSVSNLDCIHIVYSSMNNH